MRTKGDTAGHEIAKGAEKERQRKNALNVLAKVKEHQATKKGRFIWDNIRRAYFFTPA